MSRIALLLASGLYVAAAVAAVASCNTSSSAGKVCTPGREQICGCPGGKNSTQLCLEDGSGFGNCVACPAQNIGGGGAGGGADCTPPFTTLHDCGKCGEICEPGHVKGASCQSGKCIYLGGCAGSYQDCDKIVPNGCESDKLSDPQNCGACGNSCAAGGPTHITMSLCVAGKCDYLACQAPYADCDADRTNGCETDTKSDPDNCGGCTLACKPQHVNSSSCTDSKCAYDKCVDKFQDCDGSTLNGCESNKLEDKDNCGSCGKVCGKDQFCFDGVCSDGIAIKVEGHADVLVKCKPGDYSCQAKQVCEKVTGYNCSYQDYQCCGPTQGSWYPEDGQSGSSNFNFAINYDFCEGNSDYGNICACNSGQMSKYGLAANHQYCGLGHWQRVP